MGEDHWWFDLRVNEAEVQLVLRGGELLVKSEKSALGLCVPHYLGTGDANQERRYPDPAQAYSCNGHPAPRNRGIPFDVRKSNMAEDDCKNRSEPKKPYDSQNEGRDCETAWSRRCICRWLDITGPALGTKAFIAI